MSIHYRQNLSLVLFSICYNERLIKVSIFYIILHIFTAFKKLIISNLWIHSQIKKVYLAAQNMFGHKPINFQQTKNEIRTDLIQNYSTLYPAVDVVGQNFTS